MQNTKYSVQALTWRPRFQSQVFQICWQVPAVTLHLQSHCQCCAGNQVLRWSGSVPLQCQKHLQSFLVAFLFRPLWGWTHLLWLSMYANRYHKYKTNTRNTWKKHISIHNGKMNITWETFWHQCHMQKIWECVNTKYRMVKLSLMNGTWLDCMTGKRQPYYRKNNESYREHRWWEN